VEREPTIGGHMAQFDKSSPHWTARPAILTPKMSSVKTTRTSALDLLRSDSGGWVCRQLQGQSKTLARYVRGPVFRRLDVSIRVCSRRQVPDEFNMGLAKRNPSTFRSRRPYRRLPVIDPETSTSSNRQVQEDLHRSCGEAPNAINSKCWRRSRKSGSATSSWPRDSRPSTPGARRITGTACIPTCIRRLEVERPW